MQSILLHCESAKTALFAINHIQFAINHIQSPTNKAIHQALSSLFIELSTLIRFFL